MLAQMLSGAVYGIESYLVRVECTISNGVLKYFVVGLPDNAVKESAHRVTAAIRNSGFDVPGHVYTINLSPANRRKEGSSFDLPIALAILAATGRIRSIGHNTYLIMGELTLDGSVRPVRGVLPVAIEARNRGFKGILLPESNALEADVVKGLSVISVQTLRDAVDFLEHPAVERPHPRKRPSNRHAPPASPTLDLGDVKGQEGAKRALEVAAAGGHNLLFLGPPGSGKSMLAKRIAGVLPSLSFDEALETTMIHSVAGTLPAESGLVTTRPFRAPHHTISDSALVGGGSIPRPGEISLAHHGVLFLDELPEFARNVLEVLRQPLEEGKVTISRSRMTVTFPSSFMLICAMNPCPCGHFGDQGRQCLCTPVQIQRYMARISGPLMDRIDLHVEVPAVKFQDLTSERSGDTSSTIMDRVVRARNIQKRRYDRVQSVFTNAHLGPREIREFCRIDENGSSLLQGALESLGLSGRAYDRILKVSRTIADLDGSDAIRPEHLSEAIQYRTLDRKPSMYAL